VTSAPGHRSTCGTRIDKVIADAVIVVVVIFGCAGGGAALLMGDVTAAKTALLYGMAWEALLGGAIKTGKAALS
jgi:hypothetical protein